MTSEKVARSFIRNNVITEWLFFIVFFVKLYITSQIVVNKIRFLANYYLDKYEINLEPKCTKIKRKECRNRGKCSAEDGERWPDTLKLSPCHQSVTKFF